MKPIYRLFLCLIAALLISCADTAPAQRVSQEEAAARARAGKALFDEKCKTVAGEKIYRTVENVEGILLLKVRPNRGEKELADRMWPGAAFAREVSGDEYITSFLGYEYRPPNSGVSNAPQYRGYISTDQRPDGLPGYRYVDVIDEKDGKQYRYTGSEKVVGRKDTSAPAVQLALKANPHYDLNVYRYVLERSVATDPAPRYGVTFEDHLIPEERAVGIASGTIRVVDLQTGDLLAESTRYAWSPGPNSVNPSPWLTAQKCPPISGDLVTVTRQFVDQVLIPRRGK